MSSNLKQAGDVVQSFMTISRTLSDFTRNNAARLGLTIQQMGVLNMIYSLKVTNLKELTERLYMPKSTASVTVDELVNLKLIERLQSEDDRRAIKLTATESGMELAKESISNPASYLAMAKALEKLSEEDIKSLLQLHRTIESLL